MAKWARCQNSPVHHLHHLTRQPPAAGTGRDHLPRPPGHGTHRHPGSHAHPRLAAHVWDQGPGIVRLIFFSIVLVFFRDSRVVS
ncbi:hypothetical protein E2C01_016541 [Portunus trituberculatus]|uniref:Uncharacterized protein n=1 Tax=Portunus trituberculatus TaxID=210409 RepID=A0A5B7DPB6_PORTR|nr:hypothetical protein [Portunus trituberculatus]